jgi:hypothetical protein
VVSMRMSRDRTALVRRAEVGEKAPMSVHEHNAATLRQAGWGCCLPNRSSSRLMTYRQDFVGCA